MLQQGYSAIVYSRLPVRGVCDGGKRSQAGTPDFDTVIANLMVVGVESCQTDYRPAKPAAICPVVKTLPSLSFQPHRFTDPQFTAFQRSPVYADILVGLAHHGAQHAFVGDKILLGAGNRPAAGCGGGAFDHGIGDT